MTTSQKRVRSDHKPIFANPQGNPVFASKKGSTQLSSSLTCFRTVPCGLSFKKGHTPTATLPFCIRIDVCIITDHFDVRCVEDLDVKLVTNRIFKPIGPFQELRKSVFQNDEHHFQRTRIDGDTNLYLIFLVIVVIGRTLYNFKRTCIYEDINIRIKTRH